MTNEELNIAIDTACKFCNSDVTSTYIRGMLADHLKVLLEIQRTRAGRETTSPMWDNHMWSKY